MKKILLAASLILLALSAPAFAADNVVTVLNTTIGENGPLQTTKFNFLDLDVPLYFVADIGTGDTYKVQGRALAADAWIDIYSFTADGWKQIYVPQYWRVIRSVD